MIINGKNYSVDELLENIDIEKTMLKIQKNGLLLSDKNISILNKYKIEFNDCMNLKMLIFKIEDVINNEEVDSDLEELSKTL
ncbi:MAG: hypothetical protein PHU94_05720, partial [Bacilli bacterium]|nr:hypothetical protein [Bacilli bacterium]